MSRNKKWALRNALYDIEVSIPKKDRSRAAERERDLITEASVALWDDDVRKVHRSLRRLLDKGERREKYALVMDLLAE